MKIILRLVLPVALFAGLLSPFLASAQDRCRNVHFRFENQHASGRDIRVDRVIYFNVANNRDQEEDVHNIECAPRQTCITRGDNLRDSENVALDRIRFEFRVLDDDGRGWGPRQPSGQFTPSDRRCRADRNYGTFAIR